MARLGDICVIFAGQGAPQGDNNYCDRSYGVPFIKAGDLSDLLSGKPENELQCVNDEVAKKHKLKLYPSGSILFAKSGMSCMKGYVYRTQYPCYVVSHLAIVVPEKVDGEYLKFYFQYHKPNSLIKDSAYPSISLQDISNIELKLPSKEEQEAIALSLNKISKLISLRKQQLAKLDELVKARFIELFGDPESNPLHWAMLPLEKCLTVLGGYAFKSEEFKTSGVPVLRIGNINTGVFTPTNMVYWAEDDTLERYQVLPGDLVISLTGTVGKDDYGNVCILGNAYPLYYLNQRNAKLILGESLNKHYLSELLKFSRIKKKLTGISRGVRQANISNRDILNLVVPIPPIELQTQFAAFVEQIDKSKFEIQKSLEKLETLKKALMQQYFG